jgi:two-component system chemotaxis response regulator CheY
MSASPTKSVLVVDDSRLSRMLISKYIATLHPHWMVIEASTGQEGIDKARQQRPDYITMDYNMEGISGVDAAKQILQFAPRAKIVLFSANVQASIVAEAEAMGMAFVGKPVTESTMQQALNYFASLP